MKTPGIIENIEWWWRLLFDFNKFNSGDSRLNLINKDSWYNL